MKGATTHAKEKTAADHAYGQKGATMAKKKIPQTIEECNAELERTQKLLQQYENRNKMLNRKLSAEKRRERNHRTFL